MKKIVFVAVSLLAVGIAHANTGSATGRGSTRASACDQAVNKAAQDAESYKRKQTLGLPAYMKSDKDKEKDRERETAVGECTCSKEEVTGTEVCQVKWTVK